MKKINRDELFTMFYFLRIILAIVVMITLFKPWRILTLLLFLVTILVGFADYARFKVTKQYSQVDSILSSFADKLLIDLSAIALYIEGLLPVWVLVVFLTKDILFIAGGFYTLSKNQYAVFHPSTVSKITLFFQVVAIIMIMFDKPDQILLLTAVFLTLGTIIFTYFRPEIKILKKKEQLPQFTFKNLIKPADYFTMGNVLLGLLSITFAILGRTRIAASILVVAVITDYFDGKIARMTKTSSEFGKQLDSLADTVSFGVAPTVIAFTLNQSRLAIIAFSIFLICGVLRLAKYNIMESQGYYIGMPITLNGIIIPVLYFVGLPALYLPYIYLILGILMVAPVQLKKRR